MIKARLIKIASTHDLLRTDVVEGETPQEPVVGEPFFILAEPLEKDYWRRYVRTSPVLAIKGNRFTTVNSVYEFEVRG